MAKIYYTEQEAATKLGVDVSELAKLVGQGKLRVYADGPKKMYKVGEVDAIAGPGEEIELKPADASSVGGISLSDSGERPAGKDDTVITTDGISIFDEEDLEIGAADPMAKTSIAPSVEEQVSAEGVGSGSGLLDLTRESDDTSLGAEILDHIDVEGAIGSSLGAEVVTTDGPFQAAEAPPAPPIVVEEIDPTVGLFSGLIIAGSLVMLVLGAVMMPAMLGVVPGYLAALRENLLAVLIGGVVAAGVAAAAGFFVGKSTAARQLALRQAGVA
jgi:hypothetical protein